MSKSKCPYENEYVCPVLEKMAERGFVSVRPRGRAGDESHPENHCHLCSGKNIIWYADNDLWNEVVEDHNLICCPLCFVKLAKKKGIDTAWRISREGDEPEVNKLRLMIDQQGTRLKKYKEAVKWLRNENEASDFGVAVRYINENLKRILGKDFEEKKE